MKPVFIYALNCPVTGRTRYIGKTVNPQTRLREHLLESKKGKNYRAHWICSLTAQGLKPEFEILARVPNAGWQQVEMDYVAAFVELGYDLVNGTPGGDGCGSGENHPNFGKPVPPERGAKISAALVGKKLSPEHRNKLSNAHKGLEQSLETVAKRVAKLTGRKRTPEFCAACRARQTPEWRAKLRDFNIKNPNSGLFKPGHKTRKKVWQTET